MLVEGDKGLSSTGFLASSKIRITLSIVPRCNHPLRLQIQVSLARPSEAPRLFSLGG
jgi:hypothetical protein